MDWQESPTPFAPRSESSLSFFYSYYNNNNIPFPLSYPTGVEVALVERGGMNHGNNRETNKKRFSRYQIEILERSFQEEMKLDPERKMKLSMELGLNPRQIAVWFQNRRSRWKTKHFQNQSHLKGKPHPSTRGDEVEEGDKRARDKDSK
ncbi:hypothetical protein RJT34_19691 [Clitoria ternatea]|uniref:Homeobox-leucine zipper protein n=1 Tax=Clitoria ternatea TaxID=43366 RepID=A0AAN9IRH2_CLITE